MADKYPADVARSIRIVRVMLKDPDVTDQNGSITSLSINCLSWQQIEWRVYPAQCGHTHTACPRCIDTWSNDYYVEITNKYDSVYTTLPAALREVTA